MSYSKCAGSSRITCKIARPSIFAPARGAGRPHTNPLPKLGWSPCFRRGKSPKMFSGKAGTKNGCPLPGPQAFKPGKSKQSPPRPSKTQPYKKKFRKMGVRHPTKNATAPHFTNIHTSTQIRPHSCWRSARTRPTTLRRKTGCYASKAGKVRSVSKRKPAIQFCPIWDWRLGRSEQ